MSGVSGSDDGAVAGADEKQFGLVLHRESGTPGGVARLDSV